MGDGLADLEGHGEASSDAEVPQPRTDAPENDNQADGSDIAK
jgi:hypothetical protein